jgi:ketosteroid isomerase-like protein
VSQENVERVLEGYDRFNAGERVPALDAVHEDVEYWTSSQDPDTGVHRGIEAVRAQYARWVEAYPDLRVYPLEAKGHDDKVFVWVRFVGHGSTSGVSVEMEMAHVVTMRDGRFARVVEYNDRQHALNAVGLEE